MSDSDLLTPVEVAKILRTSAVTVRTLCNIGKMEHTRIGPNLGRMLISRKAVADYLERNTRQAHEPPPPIRVAPTRKLEFLKV